MKTTTAKLKNYSSLSCYGQKIIFILVHGIITFICFNFRISDLMFYFLSPSLSKALGCFSALIGHWIFGNGL